MVEISLVKAAFLKKVIDTRAIYKLGGIGLAFKKGNFNQVIDIKNTIKGTRHNLLSPLAKMTRVKICKQLKLILSSIVYILIIPGTK